MKSILVIAAALGLSVSAAGACSFEQSASAATDTMTVASITPDQAKTVTAVPDSHQATPAQKQKPLKQAAH